MKKIIYKALKTLGIFSLVAHFYRRRVLILCYHGGSLGDEWTYNPCLFMRAQTFRGRIEMLLDKGYQFISLDDLIDKNIDDLPAKSVCVTFDDGWKSTYTELIPVLADHGIPSALYLHTEKFEDQLPLHNVAVRYLISKATALPTISPQALPWSADPYDVRLKKDVDRLIQDMAAWIKVSQATNEDVAQVLRQLAAILDSQGDGIDFDDGRFDYLSKEQSESLLMMGCSVELHGHVHRYPIGDPITFKKDLTACRTSISNVGLKKPRHYCYPSGNHDAFASGVLREQNVVSATTCAAGFVGKKELASPHYLPRFLDGEDVSEIEFLAEISGVADVARSLRKLNPRKR
jgi:peptidoglycan/xylan/chitin deacetylase (PgdA/CDA1 family)